MDKFTCQVCGREIKAGNGLIAHHGYKRDYGYQTASCGGARYVPYQVSCKRLKEVLEDVKSYAAKQAVQLQNFLDNAPETITVYEKRGAWSNPEEKTYEKPADFSPDGYGYNIPRTYANAYRNMKSDYERNIRLANLDIQSMQRRVNEWKGAPEPEPEPALEEEVVIPSNAPLAAEAPVTLIKPTLSAALEELEAGRPTSDVAAWIKANGHLIMEIIECENCTEGSGLCEIHAAKTDVLEKFPGPRSLETVVLTRYTPCFYHPGIQGLHQCPACKNNYCDECFEMFLPLDGRYFQQDICPQCHYNHNVLPTYERGH